MLFFFDIPNAGIWKFMNEKSDLVFWSPLKKEGRKRPGQSTSTTATLALRRVDRLASYYYLRPLPPSFLPSFPPPRFLSAFSSNCGGGTVSLPVVNPIPSHSPVIDLEKVESDALLNNIERNIAPPRGFCGETWPARCCILFLHLR